MVWKSISKAYVFSAAQPGELTPIGVVQKVEGGFRFAYGKSWLASPTGFAIDPLNLPLTDEVKTSRRLWGALEDATPDNWGKKVMLATHSQKPTNEIEWLLATRGAGVGCLLFSGALSAVPTLKQPAEFSELEKLLAMADEIDRGAAADQYSEELVRMLFFASSMGGARPKVTVKYQGGEWIAKLGRKDDVFDQPRAEFASLQMATSAGLLVPPHQLLQVGQKTVLLIKRFDRHADSSRSHYLSAKALINADRVREGDPNSPMSYLRIAEIIQKISADSEADLLTLYRQMVFNVLIGNTDDHSQNLGFLRERGNEYRLTPSFDLIPHPGQVAEQALVIGEQGRASTIENALSRSARFGLSRAQAGAVIRDVAAVTGRAADYFRDAGMSPLDVNMLAVTCGRHDAAVQAMAN